MQPLVFSNAVLLINGASYPTASNIFWIFDKKAWGNTQNEATVYSALFTNNRREAIFKHSGWNKAFQLKRPSEQTITPNNNAVLNF